MLEYATSEAILNFTASDTVLKVHKAVKLGEGSVLALCVHWCSVCIFVKQIQD